MRASATAARPSTAVCPPVNRYSEAVMSTAPTMGPSQWRAPPRMLMSTTYSGTVIENVSPTVT
jgi:hypothetical protein